MLLVSVQPPPLTVMDMYMGAWRSQVGSPCSSSWNTACPQKCILLHGKWPCPVLCEIYERLS